MSAGSLQSDLVFQNLVDQEPIRLDVAVAVSAPITSKLVISIFGGKSLPGQELFHDCLDHRKVLASLLHPFDILLKLACLAEPHVSQEA